MKYIKLILIIAVCVGTLLAFSRSVHSPKAFNHAQVPPPTSDPSATLRDHPSATLRDHLRLPTTDLQSGDIIFRDGRGAISSVFRKCSLTDHSYSHAGVIHLEKNIAFVYHIIGGEGQVSFIRKDLLSDFCRLEETNAFGIFRSDLNPEKIDSLASEFYQDKIQFDTKFDLATDDKMYCTEMVYKILTKVSGNDNFIPLTTVNNITYCACDNIFLSPHFTKIYSSR